jgi:hypothetical protein
MITPKEKAKELVNKYKNINYDLDDVKSHKEGAFIAVNLLIEQEDDFNTSLVFPCNYWKRVKKQIEKI